MGVGKIAGQVAGQLAGAIGNKGSHVLDLLDSFSAKLSDLLDEQKRTNELLEQILENEDFLIEVIDTCVNERVERLRDVMDVWEQVAGEVEEDDVIEVEAERVDG